jgi:hypothetical protein
MEQDEEVECGLTMGIRALTITVQLECDDYAFSASRGRAKERGLCLGQVSITENTLKAARAAATSRGWRITRETGSERVRCPQRYVRFVELVGAGILNRRGEILDMARWEAGRRVTP